MYFLTSLICAGSIFLFALWYLRSKNRQEERIRTLREPERIVVEEQDPFAQRVAFPAVDSLVRLLMAILPTSLVARARKGLLIAGDSMTLSQFLTIVLVTSTAIPALYFIIAWIALGGSFSAGLIIPIPVSAAIGTLLPFLVLRNRAKRRQKAIWRSLPNAIDLMTTCVEAGLSLDFALQRVADRYKGPLSDELHRTLREIALGKTRRQALEETAERVDIPDLATLVNSIVQAEVLGTSVGQVLRTQAAYLRLRRRQYAEQMARRAPTKMVFALVFLFVPSIVIVTVGPVALNLIKTLSEN
jgi:tight adherence protein C